MQQYFGAYTEKFLAQSAYTPKTFPRKRRTSLLLSLTHYLQGPTSRLMGAYGGLWGQALHFTLEYNLTPLTQAGPPGTPPYPLGPNLPLTIGTPFNPKPYYRYFDLKFP